VRNVQAVISGTTGDDRVGQESACTSERTIGHPAGRWVTDTKLASKFFDTDEVFGENEERGTDEWTRSRARGFHGA